VNSLPLRLVVCSTFSWMQCASGRYLQWMELWVRR